MSDTTSPCGVSRRQTLGVLGAGAAVAAGVRPVRAQPAWPTRPIRILCGFAPGGLTDSYARAYGEHLGRKYGQPVTIENRTGAGGTLAVDAVAKAAPDGHTFLVSTTGPLWQGRVLYRKLPYEADRDLVPVSLFPSGGLVMGVPAHLPIRNVREFLEYAKKNKTTFGSYSPASYPHMVADEFNRTHGIDTQPVHYRGETPMWVDMVAGQLQAAIGSYQAWNVHASKGLVRAIAVHGTMRCPKVPDVPLFSEQGFDAPLFRLEGWMPMAAPAGTPVDILKKVAESNLEAFETPKIRALHESFGIPNKVPGLEETQRRWKEESPVWVSIAAKLGITLD